MDLQRYKLNLHALQQQRVISPKHADIAAIAPHLNAEQITALLKEAENGESEAFFALPPTTVRWGFWLAQLTFCAELPALRLIGCYRTSRGFAKERTCYGDRFTVFGRDQAMEYANSHWDASLILEDWKGVSRVVVQDPSRLVDNRYPTTLFRVSFTLNRGWTDVVNDRTQPVWSAWDNAIVRMTTHRIEAEELRGERSDLFDYNCACCGDGLSITGCSTCGSYFPDDMGRTGWHTPLPPKIVQFLRTQGHTFQGSPEKHWRK